MDSRHGYSSLKTLLSLNEYSNKYKVSISTLRRLIRVNQLLVHFKNGKYFLSDQKLQTLKKPKLGGPKLGGPKLGELKLSEPKLDISKNDTLKLDEPKTNPSKISKIKTSQTERPKDNTELMEKSSHEKLDLSDKLLQSHQKLCEQMELKDRQIMDLQDKLMDFQTLCAVLEKENKQLKAFSQREQVLEDWLSS